MPAVSGLVSTKACTQAYVIFFVDTRMGTMGCLTRPFGDCSAGRRRILVATLITGGDLPFPAWQCLVVNCYPKFLINGLYLLAWNAGRGY